MNYRSIGKIDFRVSSFGFGCMRFPTSDNKPMSPNIDESESITMIEYAIENGINYFDTAYTYHGGNSEIVLGKALKNGLRNKVKIATKSPVWLINSSSDFDKLLHEQLEKLNTDYLDFYLLHALGHDRWNNIILKHNVLEAAEKAKKGGLINHFGFSFHDESAAFKEVVDGYDKWEFCQVQYNYMDTENQAGTKGVDYAASKKMGIVVMEPLLGGRLANPPDSIKSIFGKSEKQYSPAEWALRWLFSNKNISTVLSGVSSLEQLKNNIRIANASNNISLNTQELEIIEEAKNAYKERIKISCTKCNYCQPCPNGVNIPRVFELYNDAFIYDNAAPPRMTYQRFMPELEKASNCIQCGECDDKCPQKIIISNHMKEVDSMLSKNIF